MKLIFFLLHSLPIFIPNFPSSLLSWHCCSELHSFNNQSNNLELQDNQSFTLLFTTMISKSTFISCNFCTSPFLPHKNPKLKTTPLQNHNFKLRNLPSNSKVASFPVFKPLYVKTYLSLFQGKGRVVCHSSLNPQDLEDPELKKKSELGGNGRDWTTSILLFFLWGGLVYYVSFLSPNQTPVNFNCNSICYL